MTAPVCLVSMPFMPVFMPALGASLLKASLEQRGIECDMYYGSLELIAMMGEASRPEEAQLDYSFLASAEDLGDAFFAGSLWPNLRLPVADLLERLPLGQQQPMRREHMVELAVRLLAFLPRTEEFFARCLASRDWSKYRIVGFSSSFSQNVASLCLARRIKDAAPNVTVVFGGANCEGDMGRELLQCFPWVDSVLQGEADATFPVYVTRVLAGQPPSPLPGLMERDGTGGVHSEPPNMVRDLDASPLPDFSDYFKQQPDLLRGTTVQIPVETARGCWWGAIQHCIFCGLNPTGMTFRSKSASRAIETFKEAKYRWGARSVVVVDNILDMDYFSTVLPHLGELGVEIFYETKSNLREWQVRALVEAGVRNIQPGIESLNTACLKHMRKGARAATQVELLKWCQTYRVRPLWFYLYGFPGEVESWYWDDIELMKRLVHLPPPRNPNPVVVDRFSPLFMKPVDFGLSNLRPAWNNHLSYAGLPPESRTRLAYHFDADEVHGSARQYEKALWLAVESWRSRYAAGSHLIQTVGDNCTLVIDGRDPGEPRIYFLSGDAHRLYSLLRTSHSTARLAHQNQAHVASTGGRSPDDMSAGDLLLLLRAAELGATLVNIDDPADLLSYLDQKGLVVQLDEQWLALAIDGTLKPSVSSRGAPHVQLDPAEAK